jgi:hypothetical protein
MSSSCRSTPPRYASRVGWADSNPLNLQRYPFQILDEVGKYIEQGSTLVVIALPDRTPGGYGEIGSDAKELETQK